MKDFPFGQRVADLEVAIIGNTDDISRIGFVNDILFLGHESGWSREFHDFSGPDMAVGGISFEFAGADFDEGDT